MADVNKLAPFILRWEGGFVNDRQDRGGATNMGVTIATYEDYCRKKGLPKPTVAMLKMLSKDQWTEILKTMYWDRWLADRIQSQSVANILVDWVWCSGSHGITRVQRILGVKADGIVGKITLAALNGASPLSLFGRIKQDRIKFLNGIVESSVAKHEETLGRKATEKELLKNTQKRYLNGWLNRLNDMRYEE